MNYEDCDEEFEELLRFNIESRSRGDYDRGGGQHLHDCPDTDGGNRCTECLLEILIRQVWWLNLKVGAQIDGFDLNGLLRDRRNRFRREREEALAAARERRSDQPEQAI